MVVNIARQEQEIRKVLITRSILFLRIRLCLHRFKAMIRQQGARIKKTKSKTSMFIELSLFALICPSSNESAWQLLFELYFKEKNAIIRVPNDRIWGKRCKNVLHLQWS